jgi:hypothetical protein
MEKTKRIFRYKIDHLGRDGRPCRGSHAVQRDEGADPTADMPVAKIVLCNLCFQAVEMWLMDPKEGLVVTIMS